MDAELKAKWAAALRSGKYPQTHSRLRDSTGFCCLGVICDVSGLGEWTKEGSGYYGYRIPGEEVATRVLPDALYSEVGSYSGVFVRDGHTETLANLNDNCGATFAELADLIEAHF